MEPCLRGDPVAGNDLMIRAALLFTCTRWGEAQLLLSRLDHWPADSVVLLTKSVTSEIETLLSGLDDWQKERILLLVKRMSGEINGQSFRRVAGFAQGGRPTKLLKQT